LGTSQKLIALLPINRLMNKYKGVGVEKNQGVKIKVKIKGSASLKKIKKSRGQPA